jgi:hypothetical protein
VCDESKSLGCPLQLQKTIRSDSARLLDHKPIRPFSSYGVFKGSVRFSGFWQADGEHIPEKLDVSAFRWARKDLYYFFWTIFDIAQARHSAIITV